LRLFLALELPLQLRESIKDEVARLRDTFPRSRWVANRNLHLTLLFLGEVGEDALRVLHANLDTAILGAPSFELVLGKPGWFRSRRKTSTFWIGIEPSEALTDLRHRVEVGATGVTGASGASGIPHLLDERSKGQSFQPHLTVARSEVSWSQEALNRWRGTFSKLRGMRIPATKVLLMQSDLHSGGPNYRDISRFPLAESST
jgi:2'-5' RNA ligase